jgi:cysteine desulfurase
LDKALYAKEKNMIKQNRPKLPIYLDYQATTPLDSRVLDVMMPYFTEKHGNPHSVDHRFGWEAEAATEKSRKDVARLIGADEDEIYFTSGATESNNIALKGIAYAHYPDKNHIITCETEHECVLQTVKALTAQGFEVTFLKVDTEGLINLEELKSSITGKTIMVSVMGVNNEIGVIQDLRAIGDICSEMDVIFHSDCAQAVGKIPLNVRDMKISSMSISGHKTYGPKGIGALYVKKGVDIIPLFDGGGQERGLRSGTLSPALCAGFGAACHIAQDEMLQDSGHIAKLAHRMKEIIFRDLENISLNGHEKIRFQGNLNFTFFGSRSDLLVREFTNIAISTGSACSSAKVGPSHVLSALGHDKKSIQSSVRIGFGRMTTMEEIEYAAQRLVEIVTKVRTAV